MEDRISIQHQNFKSSLIKELLFDFEMPPGLCQFQVVFPDLHVMSGGFCYVIYKFWKVLEVIR